MEREIIGYRLIKPEYKQASKEIMYANYPSDDNLIITSQTCINKLKQAGVLDLWCKPIYKEETFKKGEWVVITDFGKAQPLNQFSLNKAYELKNDLTEENGFITIINNKGDGSGWSNSFELGIKFRKATNLEIAKAKYPKGTKFKSVITGTEVVSDGNPYNFSEDVNICLYCVYQKGVWAEIVKEPEVPRIQMAGSLLKFTESGVESGCLKYSSEDMIKAKAIYNTFTKEEVDQIVKYFKHNEKCS